MVVGSPIYDRSQTNHANAIPELAFRPSQPSRCIMGRRLRNSMIRASPQFSKMCDRRALS